MREHEDDDQSDGIEDRLCPFMIMGRSHESLSEGVPMGAFSGQFSCVRHACMAYQPAFKACGMVNSPAMTIYRDGGISIERMGDGRRVLRDEEEAPEDGAQDNGGTEEASSDR